MTSDVLKNVLMSYLEEDKSPHFAVMIDGEWGSGKSYFIKKIILPELEDSDGYDVRYVSLFNVLSISDLEGAIFYSSNEKGKLVGLKILGGLKDVVQKQVEDNIGINLSLSDISKTSCNSWLSKETEKIRVLIFDDFERCKLSFDEIFGFVSNYLEETVLHIIFIANEGKLLSDDSYKTEKEKVIGRTYKLELDFENVLQAIYNELQISDYRKGILHYIVKNVLEYLNFNNIRVLKQSLYSLNKLLNEIYRHNEITPYLNKSFSDVYLRNFKDISYLNLIIQVFLLLDLQYRIGVDIDSVKLSNILGAFYEKEPLDEYVKTLDTGFRKAFGSEGAFIPLLKDGDRSFWDSVIKEGYINSELLLEVFEYDKCNFDGEDLLNSDVLYSLKMGYFSSDNFMSLQESLIEKLKSGYYNSIDAYILSHNLLKKYIDLNISCSSLESYDDLIELLSVCIDNNDLDFCCSDYKRYIDDIKEDTYDFVLTLQSLNYKGQSVFFDYDSSDSKLNLLIKKLKLKLKNGIIFCDVSNFESLSRDILLGTESEGYWERYNGFSEFYLHLDCHHVYFFKGVLNKIDFNHIKDYLDVADLKEQRDFCILLNKRYANLSGADKDKFCNSFVSKLCDYYQEKYDSAYASKDCDILSYVLLLNNYKNYIVDSSLEVIE